MAPHPIRRLLIANRGEIAVRIVRACKALGIETVLAVSEADRDSRAARMAERTICIGPAPSSASYLNAPALVTAAKGTDCDAVHPGYGFLSERADFQRLCAEHGLVFVGPDADAIERMGDKINAIAAARKAGVPVVPGKERIASVAELLGAAREIGYPVLLKAAAGGGGRGMRLLHGEADAAAAFGSAQAEAAAAFGDGTLYLEKYVQDARHVEIQIIADAFGNCCHLFERDCTVQRRHQKLVEEAPSPVLRPETRAEMAKAAVALARAVSYRNAGTVEFVYDTKTGAYYFLEMNTRVQVEHPVTEAVTGIDIVQEQIRIAMGLPLSFRQDDVRIAGHSIECRINAENAELGFAPSPGRVLAWDPPDQPWVRLDTHVFTGYSVPPFYDSMVGKAIVHAATRDAAIAGMADYLSKFRVDGIATTIPLQLRIIRHPDFASNRITTTWLEQQLLAAAHEDREETASE
ncbi:MAG: acetyl/propionyl/methylcrotonyl-CoA carboxylase subunit alpha [Burkholderiaceae bacterium]